MKGQWGLNKMLQTIEEQSLEEQSLIEATRALLPLVASYGDEIERERRLPQPLVETLAEAGLFKMLVPKSFGGGEVTPETFCRVIEALSQADGSTAWSVFHPALLSTTAACLEEDVAWEIFGSEKNACVSGSASPAPNPTQRPPDRAIAVDGGYRVTGRWSFNSACMHSTWQLGITAVYDGDNPRIDRYEKPEFRLLFFPKSDCQIVDTWNVVGMRGSGSHDFIVTDVFVPDDYSLPRNHELKALHSGALYEFTLSKVGLGEQRSAWANLAASGAGALCLGIARGALDALIELGGIKKLGGGKGQLHDDLFFQDQVGRAEATLRSARAFLYETIGEVWQSVLTSGPCTPNQQSLLHLAGIHAVILSAQVVDMAWKAAGSTAIFESNPFERRFRDIHVVTQHGVLRQDLYRLAGRSFLGLD